MVQVKEPTGNNLALMDKFRDINYVIVCYMINTAVCGLPQDRNRLYWLALNANKFWDKTPGDFRGRDGDRLLDPDLCVKVDFAISILDQTSVYLSMVLDDLQASQNEFPSLSAYLMDETHAAIQEARSDSVAEAANRGTGKRAAQSDDPLWHALHKQVYAKACLTWSLPEPGQLGRRESDCVRFAVLTEVHALHPGDEIVVDVSTA